MQPIPYFGERLRGNWICEPKIDGWRLQVIRYSSKRTECWGRRLERTPNWTDKLPSIIKGAASLPSGILLDCELTTKRGRRFIPSLFSSKPKEQPIVYLFDIVFYDGEFIGGLPLKERKRLLETLTLSPPFKLLEYHPLNDLKAELLKSIRRGYEGIVIKRLNSPYKLVRDGPIATQDWRKIKG